MKFWIINTYFIFSSICSWINLLRVPIRSDLAIIISITTVLTGAIKRLCCFFWKTTFKSHEGQRFFGIFPVNIVSNSSSLLSFCNMWPKHNFKTNRIYKGVANTLFVCWNYLWILKKSNLRRIPILLTKSVILLLEHCATTNTLENGD